MTNLISVEDMDRIEKVITAAEVTGNAELRKKECCSLNPECHHMLESPMVCASLRSDWRENTSNNHADTIAANDICRQETSSTGSGLPSTSPYSVIDKSGVIEELAMGNCRRPNFPLLSNPNSSMKMTCDRQSPGFYPRKRKDQVPEDISPYIRARENMIISSSKTPVGEGTQLRAVSTHGFSQLVSKRMSKGKGSVWGSPNNQNDERLGSLTNFGSDPLSSSHANIDIHSFYGVNKPGCEHSPDGFNLREWLKAGCRKKDKMDSFSKFMQIVELVDNAHSQGVVLKDLRPSYFYIRSSNKITYTGLSAEGEEEFSLNQGSNRKRPRENNIQKYYDLGVKQQKHKCDLKSFRQQSQFSSNSDFSLLEEKWYISPEELSGISCTTSSNIYCLGVLLFELLCDFNSLETHSAVMLNLRERILPPSFLSQNPREAGFCMLLLHPEPSSRPTTREILETEFTCISQILHSGDDLPVSTNDDEAESESELLLQFLASLKDRKEKHASTLIENIKCLEKDFEEVKKRHLERSSTLFNEAREECLNAKKLSLHMDSPKCLAALPISVSDKNEERLMRDMSQLEQAYFSMRSHSPLTATVAVGRNDKDLLRNRDRWTEVRNEDDNSNMSQKSVDHLGVFFQGLCKFARYSRLKVCGTLRNGNLLNSANVICSLSFDRDEEYIAAAGVSKGIKIFEYKSLLNDSIDVTYPVVEMSNKCKLSSVCWNSYIKNYMASTDYDGVVQMWDAGTGQGFCQYVEHQKRAWSVDFSQADPTTFASGSDDCSVKLWNINEKRSIGTIRNPANVCSVQFSTFSTHFLAFGSADYKVYCYDLRHTRIPWCTLSDHEKTVSHVKFLDSETIISASTDNTLKLWDLTKSSPVGLSSDACCLTFSGHTNGKNFVGLAVSDGYIACGSETNEIFSYYRSLPMPITSHKFGSIDPVSGHEIGDDTGQFVSSVCWRQKSNTILAANSIGCIKLLQLE